MGGDSQKELKDMFREQLEESKILAANALAAAHDERKERAAENKEAAKAKDDLLKSTLQMLSDKNKHEPREPDHNQTNYHAHYNTNNQQPQYHNQPPIGYQMPRQAYLPQRPQHALMHQPAQHPIAAHHGHYQPYNHQSMAAYEPPRNYDGGHNAPAHHGGDPYYAHPAHHQGRAPPAHPIQPRLHHAYPHGVPMHMDEVPPDGPLRPWHESHGDDDRMMHYGPQSNAQPSRDDGYDARRHANYEMDAYARQQRARNAGSNPSDIN
jgi:hypothetical protein